MNNFEGPRSARELKKGLLHVLVVDDDKDARQMIVDALSLMPLRLSESSNGAQAVTLCTGELPDLIIMDVMMPEMDGLEACSRIRALPGAEHIGILMLTAREGTESIVSGLSSGANDYLRKPFHYQELLARVRAQLRMRNLYRELEEKNATLLELQAKVVQQERQLLATELGGTVAHELGQPLSAILLQIHLLKSGLSASGPQRTSLEAIESDAKRIQAIVEKMKNVDANKTQEYRNGAEKILDTKN
jgi:DNA-binding response OmpR family regulator